LGKLHLSNFTETHNDLAGNCDFSANLISFKHDKRTKKLQLTAAFSNCGLIANVQQNIFRLLLCSGEAEEQ
jgi:hypothetical protein